MFNKNEFDCKTDTKENWHFLFHSESYMSYTIIIFLLLIFLSYSSA